MERRLLEHEYRFRPPKPSRFWQWALTPLRKREARRTWRIAGVEVRGESHLREAVAAGGGVMLAVNHGAHGDPLVVFEATARLGLACRYLAAWQVFRGRLGLKGWALQRMGVMSIDREGTDVRAFRTAVDILADTTYPLVIFPEGDVYHLNDRVTPLREGAAMIALTAARRRKRAGTPLFVVPCAIKYFYVNDPTPELSRLMTRLERRIHWRPQADRRLVDRIYRYAGAILALKELEYLDAAGKGTLPQRISRLSESILAEMERRRAGSVSKEPIPVRVKQVRARLIQLLSGDDEGAEGDEPTPAALSQAETAAIERDLEDLHLVTQLFSYPGDYVTEKPSIERIAETLDKLEEDALGVAIAPPRGDRRAVMSFGKPVDITGCLGDGKGSVRKFAGPVTAKIESAIQGELNQLQPLEAGQFRV